MAGNIYWDDLFYNSVEVYLVIVCFTVGQALAFIVAVSQEGFLTLSTHKMLQRNQWPSNTRLARGQTFGMLSHSGTHIIRSDHNQISSAQMSCYVVQKKKTES